jgi:glycosyltransferase involved in cell wall biosynthesis
MNKPFFSMIIPCYNTGKRIKRILDSLSLQGIEKDDLEIIIVDDNSTDKSYQEYCKDYDFNFIFAETDVNIHCPGNTRREGMKYVHGEWLCFCDHDDYYEENALLQVKSYIQKFVPQAYLVCTIMNSYDEKKQQYTESFVHKSAWLHGKFYSMDRLIKPYKINFKKDLVTHEDIYFNSCCLAALFSINEDWSYFDINTYRWVEDEESITRQHRDDRGYLFENFNDYLVCAGEPYWEGSKNVNNIHFRNQVIMTLLHAYFYYEFASYYYGPDDYVDVLRLIQRFLYRMCTELKMTPEYIIDFVYADPDKYDKVLEDCKIYCQNFIPKTSFRDFVFRLSNK